MLVVKKYSFILLIYSIFLFFILSNLIGMVPYIITVTSYFILILFFSLAFFIGNNIIGFCYHKEKYFVLFLPKCIPIFIIPFLILIEYILYFFIVLVYIYLNDEINTH